MALVDFFQLAALYNLSRSDAGFLPNPPHPPPMSGATTLARSPSPSVESGGAHPSLPISAQPTPKTPQRKRGATCSVPNITPLAAGTSSRQKLESDTDLVGKYDSADYEDFILQDFKRHRVFLDIEVFMKHVLHVPDDWKTRWGPMIEKIKTDIDFLAHHNLYCRECDTPGIAEQTLYKPLVAMGNAILSLASESSSEHTKPRTPQRYIRNDPKKVFCGLLDEAHLVPDIVAVHEDFHARLRPNERNNGCLKRSNLTWAQPLQVLEVKPFDSALVDGSCMPRLKVDGKPVIVFLREFITDRK
jgi:hypothetical protein